MGGGSCREGIQGPPPSDQDSVTDSEKSQGKENVEEHWVCPEGLAQLKTPEVEVARTRARGEWPHGGREPWQPYMEREDQGKFGFYQGNWGGNKNKAANKHLVEDVIQRNPCSILCGQEVTRAFIGCMENMNDILRTRARGDVLRAYDGSELGNTAWHVASGREGHGKTCIVAAKVTKAASVKPREWILQADGKYKNAWQYSRALIAEVTLLEPVCGSKVMHIASVHLHSKTAKPKQSRGEKRRNWWRLLTEAIDRWDVCIVSGDFNMSFWQAALELSGRVERPVSLAAWYAWREFGDASGAIAEEGEAAPVLPGDQELHDQMRYDSCGVFVMRMVEKADLKYTEEDVNSNPGKFTAFKRGQGVRISSYMGQAPAIAGTFAKCREWSLETTTRRWDGRTWPQTSERAALFKRWDPTDEMFRGGAHYPLLVWFGAHGSRTPGSMARREARQEARGWGPNSVNRSRLMQAQGKGPKPSERNSASSTDTWADGNAGTWRWDGTHWWS